MKHMPASDAKNHFGSLLDMAQGQPVTIDKKGRPVAVIMSLKDFEHYEQLEDHLWALKAISAGQEGFLTEDESQKFLDDL
jgi:antitoxin Phd